MFCTPAISQYPDVKDLSSLATEYCKLLTNVWIGSYNLLTIQLKNKSEHSVSSRMLGSLSINLLAQRFRESNGYEIDGEMSNCRINDAPITGALKIDLIR